MTEIKATAHFIVTVACFVAIVMFIITVNKREDQKEAARIKEQVTAKRDIVRRDSINRIEQKHILDSMKIYVQGIEGQIVTIEKVNAKLKAQNEKLDAIYRSLHTDMPDF